MKIGNHSKLLQSGWGWVVFIQIDYFGTYVESMKKITKFILSHGRGGGVLSFITNRKCFAHEIRMLKSYFKFMVRNFVHGSCMQIR